MEIGKPIREIVVEPLEDPVPTEEPAQPGSPLTVPSEPEKVPA